MTENTTEAPPESAVDGSEPDPTLDDTGAQPDDDVQDAQGDDVLDDEPDSSPNREAATWRRRFREAEKAARALQAELDAARHQVDQMRRADVESHLDATGVKAEALWATVELSDVLGEDGVPDPKLIDAAAAMARQRLGIPAPRPGVGTLRSGASSPIESRPTGWAQAFQPKGER
ncbi:hypothetical protein ACORG1_22965 [Mycobacterium sp. TJFP1]